MKTIDNFKDIIDKLIINEHKDEALDIIILSNNSEKDNFLKYYKEKKFNYCCMHLDTIKDRLVSIGKMENKGSFGNLSKKLYT